MSVTDDVMPSQVSRSVQALKAWHQLNVEDIAAAMNVSRATAERRLKVGEYKYDEVRALAAYFGVTIEQLEDGSVNLAESRVAVNFTVRPRRTSVSRPRRELNSAHAQIGSSGGQVTAKLTARAISGQRKAPLPASAGRGIYKACSGGAADHSPPGQRPADRTEPERGWEDQFQVIHRAVVVGGRAGARARGSLAAAPCRGLPSRVGSASPRGLAARSVGLRSARSVPPCWGRRPHHTRLVDVVEEDDQGDDEQHQGEADLDEPVAGVARSAWEMDAWRTAVQRGWDL